MATLLITGGDGFIGSNLVHHALAHTGDRLIVVDKLTYAGSLLNLEGRLKDPRVTFHLMAGEAFLAKPPRAGYDFIVFEKPGRDSPKFRQAVQSRTRRAGQG